MLRYLVGTTALNIMIVQFRNEKVVIMALYRSPLTANVVAFIVFEEGFHQPAKAHQTVNFLDVTVFRHTHLWIGFTPNAAVLFVDVAIQPEVRFIAKTKFAYKSTIIFERNKLHNLKALFRHKSIHDESRQTKLRINPLDSC
ncbi:hypothetical protein TNCV_1064961 [Trichonephila clavipes]|nr:hypothetical protein TNCV_1064961 [Trichonephila clavipes]